MKKWIKSENLFYSFKKIRKRPGSTEFFGSKYLATPHQIKPKMAPERIRKSGQKRILRIICMQNRNIKTDKIIITTAIIKARKEIFIVLLLQ